MKALALLLTLTACSTFQLGHVQALPPGVTLDQARLAALLCKDQAHIAANAPANAAAGFALGLTIVGTLIAFKMDRDIQRAEWRKCMTTAGFHVSPPTPAEE